MLKFRRLYNRNRVVIWFWLIIAIFCIAIINLIKLSYQKSLTRNNEDTVLNTTEEEIAKENGFDVVDYNQAAKSLISGEVIEKTERIQIQQTLEQFIQYVCQNQVQEAYAFLTEECKEISYPFVEKFAENYCKNLEHKTYSFQLWTSTSNDKYIYQVKFFDDLLSSGRDTSHNYIQDYITIYKKKGQYSVNINSLIQVKELNRVKESDGIEIKINKVETYLENEIYEIQVKNNREKEIILDSREQDGTTYVQNSDGLKIQALLYENKEDDLKIEAGETKTIRIKFNNTYIGDKFIAYLGFSNLIINQEAYEKDEKKEDGKIEVKIYVK